MTLHVQRSAMAAVLPLVMATVGGSSPRHGASQSLRLLRVERRVVTAGGGAILAQARVVFE
jgi:hypothetical protein